MVALRNYGWPHSHSDFRHFLDAISETVFKMLASPFIKNYSTAENSYLSTAFPEDPKKPVCLYMELKHIPVSNPNKSTSIASKHLDKAIFSHNTCMQQNPGPHRHQGLHMNKVVYL